MQIAEIEDSDISIGDDFYNNEEERYLIEKNKDYSPEDRKKVRKHVINLKEDIGKSYVKMGGLFYTILKNKMYLDWGYSSFNEYIENEVDYSTRKAHFLKRIWERFKVDLNVDTESLNTVGWTKSKEIAKIHDKDKREKVLNDAEKSITSDNKEDLTVNELEKTAKQLNKDEEEGDDADVRTLKQVTLNFYKNQKELFDKAIKKASDETDSEKRNYLLSMICLHYLSSSFGDQELNFLLNQIEKSFGLRILAFDEETGEMEYGDIEE